MGVLERIFSHPESGTALVIGDRRISYGELRDGAARLASVLAGLDGGPPGLVAMLSRRSLSAYLAPLAAHIAGLGYMPMHVDFPPGRNAGMLRRSGARVVVVGAEGLAALAPLLAEAEAGLTIIAPETGDLSALAARHPGHRFIAADETAAAAPLTPCPAAGSRAAYLLFTSGSTGTPKGVPVSFDNLNAYVDYVVERYAIGPTDRCSQTFDQTFDLSVHDMFVTWAAGAALHVLSPEALLNPGRFIRTHELTAWFSVPSAAMLMMRMRTLRPGAFPSLRLSLFCGEPLTEATAATWQEAAPASRVVNLYGPTEATIAFTEHEWQVGRSTARYGVVAIGRPFIGQQVCLLDEHDAVVEGEGRGELLLGGSQVTAGYLDDPATTAAQFLRLPATGEMRWYRTGDIVERDAAGELFFVRRRDKQVKIRGYRIELQEVDQALRDAAGTELAVTCVLSPPSVPEAQLIGFVARADIDPDKVRAACAGLLPDYMVPTRVVAVRDFPFNTSGKIDRKALVAQLSAKA